MAALHFIDNSAVTQSGLCLFTHRVCVFIASRPESFGNILNSKPFGNPPFGAGIKKATLRKQSADWLKPIPT
jgi:hypothetical protein